MAEQYSSLPNAFSKVITDLADLMQKEMRLAQAELSEKLSISIRAGVWMSARSGSGHSGRVPDRSSDRVGPLGRDGDCAALVLFDRGGGAGRCGWRRVC